ncbi:hypothetical protein ACJMK2_009323 [Sinanodonta woodiana]|uniref:Uncharacterized protein n=1 Tax=Sinanodonta woodiana TaxID=1069815 RepID=A0ABD3VBX8_SINWO
MSCNTVVDDPGIPLVNIMNEKSSKCENNDVCQTTTTDTKSSKCVNIDVCQTTTTDTKSSKCVDIDVCQTTTTDTKSSKCVNVDVCQTTTTDTKSSKCVNVDVCQTTTTDMKSSTCVNIDVCQTTTTGTSNILSNNESKLHGISYRLRRRKYLFQQRRRCVNFEFAVTIISLLIMLVETELLFAGVIGKTSTASIILKMVLSGTTFILWYLVVTYHAIGIQIHMTENGWKHWQLAVRFPWTYLKILMEIVVCAVHPLPGNIIFQSEGLDGQLRMVSPDGILSILMLGRLYIIGRFIVIHSKLLTDTSTQSLGALNKVKISTAFVLKALMSAMPGTMLISIMVFILLINSWAMRTCEVYYHPGNSANDFLNSMWLICITFLTVGYGDMYPNTYCGRVVSVISGLMGVGTTALLITLLASKLEQSRAEKYVYNFVSQIQLDKELKAEASNIIKRSLMLWKMRHVHNEHKVKIYRKLLKAIHAMQAIRNHLSSIRDSAVGSIEINKSVNDIYEYTEKMKEEQSDLKDKVRIIENKLFEMDEKLDVMVSSIIAK